MLADTELHITQLEYSLESKGITPQKEKFTHPKTDTTKFVEEQLKDQHLQKLLRDNSTSLNLAKVRVPNSNLDIVCDTSTGKIRPFVPELFQRIFFSSFHNLFHPDANASVKLLTERYVWPRMKSDIRLWARTCELCQKAKVGRHTRTPVDLFLSPDERFEHVHIDVTCPLSPCKVYTYLLTCVDRFHLFVVVSLKYKYYTKSSKGIGWIFVLFCSLPYFYILST